MSRDILDLIDGVIDDHTSADAMRWTPTEERDSKPKIPLGMHECYITEYQVVGRTVSVTLRAIQPNVAGWIDERHIWRRCDTPGDCEHEHVNLDQVVLSHDGHALPRFRLSWMSSVPSEPDGDTIPISGTYEAS